MLDLSKGVGPSIRRPTEERTSPVIIMIQWLSSLSATQPQMGLNIPYKAANNKNIKPT